jgi:hypothetical protein
LAKISHLQITRMLDDWLAKYLTKLKVTENDS